jgi:heterotetrameric sarcosine oxidase gamma subunit
VADPLSCPFAPGRFGKGEGAPGVCVRGHPFGLLASVIARRGAVPVVQASIARLRAATVSVIHAGPDHWWIEAAPGALSIEGLQSMFEGTASVFDQSDSRIVLEVGGPRIRDALAKGLPIDLHPSVFRNGDAAITTLHHISVHVWQIDAAPRYRLAVPRSYFGSFWRGFAAAAAEYGCEVGEVSPSAA